MARPKQSNLDYFPMNTDIDNKLKLLKAKFKLEGIGFYDMLLRAIYKEGYYLELTPDLILLLSDEFGISTDRFNEMLNFCVSKNLFSDKISKKYNVLTSAGIQKRYLEIKKRADEVPLMKQYLCISETETPVNVTLMNANVTSTKKRKVNETKENKFNSPSLKEVEEFFKLKGYSQDIGKRAWEYYDTAGWKDSRGKQVRNWRQKMIAVWFKDENKTTIKKESEYE